MGLLAFLLLVSVTSVFAVHRKGFLIPTARQPAISTLELDQSYPDIGGSWANQQARITQSGSSLTVTWANGRPTASGAFSSASPPTLWVNFTDDHIYSGAVSPDGTQITWNATNIWKKVVTCAADGASPPNGATGNCSVSATYQGTCVQTCNTGYTTTLANLTRTCQASGTYSPSVATCAAVTCADGASPLNGATGNCSAVTIYKGTCVQTCNTGYTATLASLTRTCQANGRYTPSVATCAVVSPYPDLTGFWQSSEAIIKQTGGHLEFTWDNHRAGGSGSYTSTNPLTIGVYFEEDPIYHVAIVNPNGRQLTWNKAPPKTRALVWNKV